MGFRLNRTYKLEFAGDLEGLEIRIRATSFQTAVESQKFNILRPEEMSAWADIFADHLVDWNYEGADGNPVPATREGVLSLEFPVVKAIRAQWDLAALGVTAPLDLGSTDGDSSEEPELASIPMETL